MTRFVICIAFLTLSTSSSSLQAQDNAIPAHHHAQANVIDGAIHPELIPDLTAFRLYLLSVSKPQNAVDEETKRQAAQIGRIGLQDADQRTIVAVLATFESQYRALVRAFNEDATAAWNRGEKPDKQAFLLQRDQIVQSACDTLKARLTSAGWAGFAAHVQGEKKRMKISAKGDGQ